MNYSDEKYLRKNLIVFILINYTLSIALSFLIGSTGGHESSFISLGYISMFIPAVAVLIMITIFKAPLHADWNRVPVKWIPVALFLMPVIIHAVCLPLIAYLNNGNFPWQSWLKPNSDDLYQPPPEKGWGILTGGELSFRIVANALVGVAIVSVLAFFEEIGWRAWMLPRLIKIFGAKKGVSTGAFIWALWHVPFVFSGISYIDTVPLYAMLLVPVGIFGAGIIISWLWLKTKSIWIVSLAHGALNNWGQYAFKYMQDLSSLHSVILLIGVEGSLLIAGVMIFITMRSNYDECYERHIK